MTDAHARVYVRDAVDVAGEPFTIVGKLRRGTIRAGVRVSVGTGGLLFAQAFVVSVLSRAAPPDDDDVTVLFEATDDDHRWLLKEICERGSTIGVIENND